MQIEISANTRDGQGTGASRRLRRAGRVPGILYGGGRDAQAIDLDHKELFQNLRNEAFHASILTMDLAGRKEQVLLRDVQMHAYKRQVLHVDFQRVAQDQAIHLKVPLHFLNEAVSPGVKIGHGIVSHVMTELDVICLPKDLPEFIEVDLGHLDLGDSVHVSQVTLPAGVEAVALRSGEDPVVATVQGHAPTVEGEAVEGEAAAGGETPAA